MVIIALNLTVTLQLQAAGVSLLQTNGSTQVAEAGVGGNPQTDSFTLALTTLPSDNVVITLTEVSFPGWNQLSARDPNDIIIAPTRLIFTPANFADPQTVTLTAIDDTIIEPDFELAAPDGFNHTAVISLTSSCCGKENWRKSFKNSLLRLQCNCNKT